MTCLCRRQLNCLLYVGVILTVSLMQEGVKLPSLCLRQMNSLLYAGGSSTATYTGGI